ncbi:Spy/CpxP family protein refolding chaperone [Rhizosaccharibacter radicis]|uniref:Spy/CpxP family protein refolding chaperone n=1 Tax=Rhizosaccharibacter radicis TaxID=2782605 RepID=A0ABT1VWD1_9PROT|nr:Spy/CpxP family protein refolding chaperone [Acetobacteraceae bacterium KSS12]
MAFPPPASGRFVRAAHWLLAALALASATPGPARAQAGPGQPPPGPVSAPASGSIPAGSPAAIQSRLGRQKAARIESNLTALHRALAITPAQDPLWQTFADTLRRNVGRLDIVYAEREARNGRVSAVDDLGSYARLETIAAQNAQTMIGPFRALYDSFTDAQKRIADSTLRRFTDRAVRRSG